MLASAVMFWQVILALHIFAVVAAFGVTFAYPVIFLVGEKLDRRSIPLLHRLEQALGRRLINPGLLVVLIAGIYLASHLHDWKQFFVQWGLGVAIVLGALEGALMIPTAGKAAAQAEQDLAAGGVQWSPEYRALRTRLTIVGGTMCLLVLITVYVMTVNSI
jgi:uncharacterized membrane protein